MRRCILIGLPGLDVGMKSTWRGVLSVGVKVMVGKLQRQHCGCRQPITGQICVVGCGSEGHGTLPRISLAVQLDDVAVPVAKRFWVRSKMSRELIDWLNAALVNGSTSGGFALIEGELKDWPFNNHDGYFEAAGRIHGGVMRFQSEWPVLEKLDADIAFIGNGFSIKGRGSLLACHKFSWRRV